MIKNPKQLLNFIKETSPNSLTITGFDSALIGYIEKDNKILLVYSINKILKVLQNQGNTYEESIDFFEYNIQGTDMGDYMPIYVHDELLY